MCSRLFPIPSQLQYRSCFLSFIKNRAMLQISQVKLSYRPIRPCWTEHISLFCKMNIINFFIMSNQLCKNSLFLDIPNGTSCVDRAGSNQVWDLWVPIKRCERCWKLIILYKILYTFFKLSLSSTYSLSLISQILRFSPEVASRSGLVPF